MELRKAPQVPFAYEPVNIPQLGQPVGQGGFIHRQSAVLPVYLKLLVGWQIRIGVKPEFAIMPPGK